MLLCAESTVEAEASTRRPLHTYPRIQPYGMSSCPRMQDSIETRGQARMQSSRRHAQRERPLHVCERKTHAYVRRLLRVDCPGRIPGRRRAQ